jgi:hypothetical protein
MEGSRWIRQVDRVQIRADLRVRMGCWCRVGLRLELEPPVAGEQHLDPDVSVLRLDQAFADRSGYRFAVWGCESPGITA